MSWFQERSASVLALWPLVFAPAEAGVRSSQDASLVVQPGVALALMVAGLFGVHALDFPRTLARIGSDTLLAAKLGKDPGLIPNSIYNLWYPNTLTLADKVPAWLARAGVDPFMLELGLLLALISLGVVGVYVLAHGIWRDRFAALLAVVLVMETQFQNLGTSQRFAVGHAPLLAYFGLAGVAFALGLSASGRPRAAWLAAGLLFNIHPVHSLVGAAVLGVRALGAPPGGRLRGLGTGVGWYLLGALPLVAYALVSRWPPAPGATPVIPAEAWWHLITLRKYSIVYPFLTNERQWAFIAAFVGAGVMAWWRARQAARPDPRERDAHRLAAAVGTVVGASLVVGTVGVTLIPVRLVASLALYRTIPYLLLVAAVYLAKVLADLLRSRDWRDRGIALACLIAAMAADEPGVMLLLALVLLARLTRGGWRRLWAGAIAVGALLSLGGHLVRTVVPEAVQVSRLAWIVGRFDVSQRVWVFYVLALLGMAAAWKLRGSGGAGLSRAGGFAWTPVRLTVLLLVFFILGLFPAAYALPDFKRTSTEGDWLDVQRWAKAHTPPGTVFINPPDQWWFELFSERGQIISTADIGLSIYTPATFATEVERTRDYGVDLLSSRLRGKLELGRALTANYAQFTEADFLRLGRKYGATFAIVDAERILGFESAYRNGRFRIYRLPLESTRPEAAR